MSEADKPTRVRLTFYSGIDHRHFHLKTETTFGYFAVSTDDPWTKTLVNKNYYVDLSRSNHILTDNN